MKYSLLPCAAVSILMTALAVTAEEPRFQAPQRPVTTTVRDYFGNERILFDADQDGWDDLWCGTHKEIEHRDRGIDTDDDGLTDYEV